MHVAWSQLHGPLELPKRLPPAPLLEVDAPKVHEGELARLVASSLLGLLQPGDGLLELPLLHQVDPDVVIRITEMGVDLLVWAIRTPYLQNRILERARGDMIRHLVLREIRALTVPVPPVDEQRRLVGELDALQAKVDVLKRLRGETAAELDALLPAILDRAFKGEPV
jgi:hypothetical protein